eukprot:Polyplicarium_translucidae@DN729_c0_g1_i1.p1
MLPVCYFVVMKLLFAAIPFVVSANHVRRALEEKVVEGADLGEGRAAGRFYLAQKLEPLGYIIEPIWDKTLIPQIPGGVLTKEYRFEPIIPPPLPPRAKLPRMPLPLPPRPVKEYVKDVSDIDMFKSSRFFVKADDLPDLFHLGKIPDLDHVEEAFHGIGDKFHQAGAPIADKFHQLGEPIVEKLHGLQSGPPESPEHPNAGPDGALV